MPSFNLCGCDSPQLAAGSFILGIYERTHEINYDPKVLQVTIFNACVIEPQMDSATNFYQKNISFPG